MTRIRSIVSSAPLCITWKMAEVKNCQRLAGNPKRSFDKTLPGLTDFLRPFCKDSCLYMRKAKAPDLMGNWSHNEIDFFTFANRCRRRTSGHRIRPVTNCG